MRKQAGFTLYAIFGLLIVVGLMGVALKVQSSRLESAKADLHVCETRYAETLKLVAKQNQAVENLKKDADKRAAVAAAALAKARTDGKAKEAEISRLSAFKANPVVASSCAKGVEAVRSLLN